MLRKENKGVVKEMLISKDSKGIANAKKELFLERRIIMQGLAHSHVHGNRQIRRRMLYYFLFRQYKNHKLFAIIICSTLQVEMCIYKNIKDAHTKLMYRHFPYQSPTHLVSRI